MNEGWGRKAANRCEGLKEREREWWERMEEE